MGGNQDTRVRDTEATSPYEHVKNTSTCETILPEMNRKLAKCF